MINYEYLRYWHETRVDITLLENLIKTNIEMYQRTQDIEYLVSIINNHSAFSSFLFAMFITINAGLVCLLLLSCIYLFSNNSFMCILNSFKSSKLYFRGFWVIILFSSINSIFTLVLCFSHPFPLRDNYYKKIVEW